MTTLIGLGGYAYSGKDAFADVLEKDLGWYKTYMSKALRECLEVLNPIIEHDFWNDKLVRFGDLIKDVGYEKAKEHKEVRALLQRMGTEVGRKLWHENFWVDLCFSDVANQLMMKNRNVTVTGIRYPNELNRVHNLSGVTIWVERPGYVAVNEHSSDNSLTKLDFDYVFTNGGTLEDLSKTIPEFLKTDVGMTLVEEGPSMKPSLKRDGDPFGWLND